MNIKQFQEKSKQKGYQTKIQNIPLFPRHTYASLKAYQHFKKHPEKAIYVKYNNATVSIIPLTNYHQGDSNHDVALFPDGDNKVTETEMKLINTFTNNI